MKEKIMINDIIMREILAESRNQARLLSSWKTWSEIYDGNESLSGQLLLDIGIQDWENGRLTNLNLSSLDLISLPESICNLNSNCRIDVSSNQLCQEFEYDCIDVWGTQSGLDIMDCAGVCNGDNFYVDETCGSCSVNLWGECYNIQTTTSVGLVSEGLTGSIPREIGKLTNLTSTLKKLKLSFYQYFMKLKFGLRMTQNYTILMLFV